MELNMKKIIIVLMSVLMLCMLCSCGDSETIYTVEKEGKNLEVNTENNTIFDGKYTYNYIFSGDTTSYVIEITYPNGSTYYLRYTADTSDMELNGNYVDEDYMVGITDIGTTGNYDEVSYMSGAVLSDVIAEQVPSPSGNPLVAIVKVIIVFVIIAIVFFYMSVPREMWFLQGGWKYKDAEPSDMALEVNRIGGILIIVVGIIVGVIFILL